MKNKTTQIKIRLGIMLCISIASTAMNAQELGMYEFTDNGTACPHNTATTVNVQPTNVTFSPYISVGTTCAQSNYQFNNSNWETGSTINLNEYNEFTITADPGFVFSLDTLSFAQRTNSTIFCNWHLRSSLDNYASDIFTGVTPDSWDYPEYYFSGFTNISTVTFRFYVTDIETSASTWRQDFVKVTGVVTSSTSPITWYADVDNDGYGDDANTEIAITSTLPNAKTVGGDCNDNDDTVNPGETEICDGKDNNCVGGIDEGLATTMYFVDGDGDGFGTGSGTAYCSNPGAGFSSNNTDCNDGNAAINPGATDIIGNGIDEDCFGGDSLAGMDELNAVQFYLSPNPGQDEIVVQTLDNLSIDLLLIKSLSGSLVYELKEFKGESLTISTRELESGIYFIELTSGAKKGILKWIKN